MRRALYEVGICPKVLQDISIVNINKIENINDLGPLYYYYYYHMAKEYSNLARSYSGELKTGLSKRVYKYVHTHIYENVKLKDIATHLHMVPSYLAHRFKKDTSITITEAIQRTKITYAREDIIRGQDSISSIGAKYGFTDGSYFCKIFKKYIGYTPSQYKTNNNG
ncbi:helix-turn-helix transcriptional regulator [Anaeromicrobium sediminis]|nr:helix-turn-helix transcriptional regulator [Anaeromicrobium sediminis]